MRAATQLPGFSGDTSPFLGLAGVPSAQLGFGRRTYAQYHSAYHDPYLLGRILDPGYAISATLLDSVYTEALGPWNRVYEEQYQKALANFKALDSTAGDALLRATLLKKFPEEFWRQQ